MLVRLAIDKQLLPSGGSVIKINRLCCLQHSLKIHRSNPFKWLQILAKHVQKEVSDACKGIRVSVSLICYFVILVYFH